MMELRQAWLRTLLPRLLFTALIASGVASHCAGAAATDDTAAPASASCLAAPFIDWANTDAVQNWLRDYNRTTTLQQVHQRDAAWAGLKDSDPIVQAVLKHPAAAALRTLQNHYSVLGESFLIGANGGLVAATLRTTDYWQGDEPQFTETVPLPPRRFRLMRPGVDESSRAMLAKMTIPIHDHRRGQRDQVIGVLVLGFDQLVVDFERPCNGDGGQGH